MTPEQFIEYRRTMRSSICALEAAISDAGVEAMKSPPPPGDRLEPLTSLNLHVGLVVWLKGDAGSGWNIVAEVNTYHGVRKGYVAEDGFQYGLENSFVEVKW
jgi:hypothetical protein